MYSSEITIINNLNENYRKQCKIVSENMMNYLVETLVNMLINFDFIPRPIAMPNAKINKYRLEYNNKISIINISSMPDKEDVWQLIVVVIPPYKQINIYLRSRRNNSLLESRYMVEEEWFYEMGELVDGEEKIMISTSDQSEIISNLYSRIISAHHI